MIDLASQFLIAITSPQLYGAHFFAYNRGPQMVLPNAQGVYGSQAKEFKFDLSYGDAANIYQAFELDFARKRAIDREGAKCEAVMENSYPDTQGRVCRATASKM